MLGDRAIGGEKPLRLARGFEPLHALLPLPGGLVRILRAIIEIPVLTMFHPWQDLALGGSVALELLGNDHARDVGQSLEELAEKPLCRLLISATLNQNIQYIPVLIDCPPEIVMRAFDGEKHLIEVPFIARSRTSPSQLVRQLAKIIFL